MSPVVPIVAFQGESGAFSEAAAGQLIDGPLTLLPCATFDDAVRAVVNGHADYAVMPIRNSIAGPVNASVDAMSAFTSLEQVGETVFPVRLALLGLPDTQVDDIRQVLSHQMALLQCQRFLAAHPAIEAVEAHDTAGAARLVAIRRDRTVAAIAGAWAAKIYGMAVIAEGLEDNTDNATTFALVRRKPRATRYGE